MKLARHIFSDLVEKRLWPVAVALVIALIAIPVGLSKSPSEHAATGRTGNSPLAGEWSRLLGEATPVVSLAAQTSTPTYRKRLSRLQSKNPFVQQAIIRAKTQSTSSSGTGGAAPGGASTPVAPVSLPNSTTTSPSTGTGSQPSEPAQPEQFNYTATVSFGLEGKVSKKTLLLTDPLPNADNPIVAFMGASDGGKKAVFVVFAGASPRGVGECKPSADKCNFLYLKKGDVELFDVTGTDGSMTTYELDLEKIGIKTVSSSAAHSSVKHGRPHSSAGTLAASPAR